MNFVSGGEILMINKIHDEEIRILISDSNPENRKAFSKALKEKYLIIEAENGAETLRVLVEENYSIDLMIIANKLSDKTLVDVLKDLKNNYYWKIFLLCLLRTVFRKIFKIFMIWVFSIAFQLI